MAAGQRRTRGLEHAVNPAHEAIEDAGLHGLRISICLCQLLSRLGQGVAFHLVKEGSRADYRQQDVDEVTDVEEEGEDGDVVEELLPAAQEQGEAHPAYHEVIRAVGG